MYLWKSKDIYGLRFSEAHLNTQKFRRILILLPVQPVWMPHGTHINVSCCI